jgi:hypothetical protein
LKYFVGKLLKEIPFRIPRRRLADYIQMDLKKISCEPVEWIQLVMIVSVESFCNYNNEQ